jgi:hypothetical protein
VPSVAVGVSATIPIPIWPLPPVSVILKPSLNVNASGTFSYDTLGLRSGNLFDGFMMKDVKLTVTAGLGLEGALGLSDTIAIAGVVQLSGTAVCNLTNGNPSSPSYQTTTIRGPDLPFVNLNPAFTVTGQFNLDLEIEGKCAIGVQLGSITLDDAGHVNVSGFGFGC